MYEFRGLHHVLLSVPNDKLEEAHRFYEEVLGFQPLKAPPELGGHGDLWWYECGAAQVHIVLEENFRPHQKAHPAIQVSGLEALRERLRQHGIETSLDYRYPGARRFFIRDPFGNRLEFIEPEK